MLASGGVLAARRNMQFPTVPTRMAQRMRPGKVKKVGRGKIGGCDEIRSAAVVLIETERIN